MARRNVATTVYLTEEQREALVELSKRTRVPVAVYVREGLDLVLARHAPRESTLAPAADVV